MEKLIDSWKNQFNLLELGTKYIEKIADEFNKDIEKLYMEYPLWPMAAITSNREIHKLYKKIESHKEKLIYPILVLSQEEATKIILGKSNIEERYIYPSIWQENIDRKRFQKWKESLSLSARETVEERKNKEKEEKDCDNRLKTINEFLTDHPHEKYSRLKENHRELEGKLEDRKNKVEENQIENKNISNEINEYESKLKSLEQESDYLEKNINKVLKYFQIEREIEKVHNQLFRKSEEVNKINKDIDLNKKNIKTSEGIVQDIGEEIGEIRSRISIIIGDSNYKEVKDSRSLYKSIEKQSILEEREYIKNLLSQKQKDRPSLERELEIAIKNKESGTQSLDIKYKRARYPLDEALV